MIDGHNVVEVLSWIEQRHGRTIRKECEAILASAPARDPFAVRDEVLCKINDLTAPDHFAEIQYNG